MTWESESQRLRAMTAQAETAERIEQLKLLVLSSERADEAYTKLLGQRDWKPSRAHLEGARNAIRTATEAARELTALTSKAAAQGVDEVETVMRAMNTFAMMYSHQTVGDDLRTVNRKWAIYHLDDTIGGKRPEHFLASFDDKSAAYQDLCRRNADAVLAALARPAAAEADGDLSAARQGGVADGWSRHNPKIEEEAKRIYETWSDQAGYVPWVPNGNSTKQDEARQLAMRVATPHPGSSDTAGDE